MDTILEAIVGSQAYGLATEDSDEDRLGVFVAPMEQILSLEGSPETLTNKNPDMAHHEVKKFIKLALGCNPTILELLFMEEYTKIDWRGKLLVKNRSIFLSKRAFDTYIGYATSQMHKLAQNIEWQRWEKHARHCFRLLQQGRELVSTGKITVKVSNSEELMAVGKLPLSELAKKFEEEKRLINECDCVLPDEPNFEKANQILLDIRHNFSRIDSELDCGYADFIRRLNERALTYRRNSG